jgi:hypothetical protein
MSTLSLPAQKVQLIDHAHYDLRHHMKIATLLWDSYATETKYVQYQDPRTMKVQTKATTRTYIDGSYIEQRMMDRIFTFKLFKATHRGGSTQNNMLFQRTGESIQINLNAKKYATWYHLNQDEDPSIVSSVLPVYVFVVKSNAIRFYDGTRKYMGKRFILLLESVGSGDGGDGGDGGVSVSRTHRKHALGSLLLECLMDAVFGITPISSMPPTLKSSAQQVTASLSQIQIDVSFKYSILIRLESAIQRMKQLVQLMDTFARRHLGHLGQKMYDADDSVTDVDVLTEDTLQTTQHKMFHVVHKLMTLALNHLEKENELLSSYKEATSIYIEMEQLYKLYSVHVETSKQELSCCTVQFERIQHMSNSMGWIMVLALMVFMVCIGYAISGVLENVAGSLSTSKRK